MLVLCLKTTTKTHNTASCMVSFGFFFHQFEERLFCGKISCHQLLVLYYISFIEGVLKVRFYSILAQG